MLNVKELVVLKSQLLNSEKFQLNLQSVNLKDKDIHVPVYQIMEGNMKYA